MYNVIKKNRGACIGILLCIGLLIFSNSNFSSKLKERLFFLTIHESYKDDWHNTSIIREWVASHTPSSSDSLSIRSKLWKNNPYMIFLKFYFKYGGVDCAGYSYALMKLYKEFGYRAFSYHSGRLDAFNHVITLVEIKYKGNKRLIIQDATFDAEYLNEKGEPYDFFRFINILQTKEYRHVKIIQGNSPPHMYICDLSDESNCRTDSKKGGFVAKTHDREIYLEKLGINTLTDNRKIYLIPRLLQTMQDKNYTVKTVEELITLLHFLCK